MSLTPMNPITRIVEKLKKRLPFVHKNSTILDITHNKVEKTVTFHMAGGNKKTFYDTLLIISHGD
jgi:hypothetical protein